MKEIVSRTRIIKTAKRLGYIEPLSIPALCAVEKYLSKKGIDIHYGMLSATYAGITNKGR